MSKPRSDKAVYWTEKYHLYRERAEQLERENAALQTENAALAKAFDRLGKKLDKQQDDSKRMDWLQNNEWYWNSKRRDLRKAVDKGMKNTQ